jgi:hypothetical protein
MPTSECANGVSETGAEAARDWRRRWSERPVSVIGSTRVEVAVASSIVTASGIPAVKHTISILAVTRWGTIRKASAKPVLRSGTPSRHISVEVVRPPDSECPLRGFHRSSCSPDLIVRFRAESRHSVSDPESDHRPACDRTQRCDFHGRDGTSSNGFVSSTVYRSGRARARIDKRCPRNR